jgi:penicillin-binding protein 1C
MTGAASKSRPGRVLRGLAVGVAGLLIASALTAGTWLDLKIQKIEAALPPAPDPAAVPVSTVVLDRNGQLLRPFTIAEGRWRLPAEKQSVDPRYLAMLIAYEDKRFFDHRGVDWRALLRAAAQFALSGRIVSGGSTVTMQVARLLEGDTTRSLDAKLRQIVRARALERALSKDDILTLYLTLAPFGGNIEGIRAATLAYFGKEPNRLTAAEAALLVALPQSPEKRRPDRDPAVAQAARDRVLDRLAASGTLDADEAEVAKREKMPAARKDFPKFAAHLGQQALSANPGVPVHRLTIDRDVQAALERLAAARANLLGPKLSLAIVVAEHATGAIRASVGSAGLFAEERQGYVDMTRALRSPGSTLKPFIYGLAFEEGLAHPESLIEDRPSAFSGYVPVNFDGASRGTVTIRRALTESLNVPAVVALDAVGTAALVARLKRAGARPALPGVSAPGLAVGLGGVGISLRDLVGAYAAIANGGTPVPLHDGVTVSAATPRGAPVLDRTAAWYVADILADVPPPVTGTPGRVAYKTGTSYGYRDAWAIGFDGRHVVGVWIGRPDGTPVAGLSGYSTAAPILFDAFDRLGARVTPLPAAPPGAIADVSTSALPAPLRRFRHPGEAIVARDPAPEIAFPREGVHVDLGLAEGSGAPLVVKVRNGAPPFTFLANGVPFGRSRFARSESYAPDGPGFVTISVIDGKGRATRVTVFVE